MRFDGAVFDLDGTLVDALEGIADAVNRALGAERLGRHGYEAYRLMIGRGIRNLIIEALPAERRDDQTVDRVFARMIADYRGHCLVKTRLFDGIVELLAGLRDEGVTLAVFSNKADDLTRRIVESLIGADVFEEVVGAQPAIPLKPDPAGALLVAGRLGIVPERIAFVGDSGIDMLTATRAGMIAVGVSWGLRERDELLANGADAIIDHPLELLELRE